MSQRSSLVVFCFTSALLGGIVATQSVGWDRATAQVAQSPSPATLVAFPRLYPTWKYWFGIVPAQGMLEIVPPGNSGVLHSFYCNTSLDVREGSGGGLVNIFRRDAGAQSPTTLDARFSDGLSVSHEGGGVATVTVLYELDVPISVAIEK